MTTSVLDLQKATRAITKAETGEERATMKKYILRFTNFSRNGLNAQVQFQNDGLTYEVVKVGTCWYLTGEFSN